MVTLNDIHTFIEARLARRLEPNSLCCLYAIVGDYEWEQEPRGEKDRGRVCYLFIHSAYIGSNLAKQACRVNFATPRGPDTDLLDVDW